MKPLHSEKRDAFCLTSSDLSSISNDSGRSETWAGSNGIWGERSAKCGEVLHGVVTETDRDHQVVDGFETDDVIDYDTSNEVGLSLAAYISSTTDEGICVGELETLYNDDVIMELNGTMDNGRVGYANRHGRLSIAEPTVANSARLTIAGHGRLSIAGCGRGGDDECDAELEQVNGGGEEDESTNCHGMPSIAAPVVGDNSDNSHGRLSIAELQRGGYWGSSTNVNDGDNSHGRLSIAEQLRGGLWDTTDDVNDDDNGKRDSTCGEKVGGGAQPFQWQNLDPSHRMDNGQHVDEGKGSEGQEGTTMDDEDGYVHTDDSEGEATAGDEGCV